MKNLVKKVSMLIMVIAMLIPNGIIHAEDAAKFPAFPNSSNFDNVSSYSELFEDGMVSKDSNWRSEVKFESGIYEKEATDKSLVFSVADPQNFYPLNATAYITNPSSDVSASGKDVTIEFSLAANTKNITKAGLMIGTGLNLWESDRESVECDNADCKGIVGFGSDGIYAFGEKIMDYDAENWYKFKLVIYGGTTSYDLYVNDSLVKEDGQVTSAFTNIARTAFVGRKTSPSEAISIYFDDVSTSYVARPKFPVFPHSTDFSMALSASDEFTDISKDSNWRSEVKIVSGIYGKESTDKALAFSVADPQNFYPLNSTAYITNPSSDVSASGKNVTFEFSMAANTKNITKAGLMIGTGLNLWESDRESAECDNADCKGIVGFGSDGIYAFGEKIMDYDVEKWYDFDVIIYGGTTSYDLYVNDSLVKENGQVTSAFTNIARTALVGRKTSPSEAISIYFDDVSTSYVARPKFPAFPYSTDFSMASSVSDEFTDTSKDSNWRSTLTVEQGIYGKAAEDKTVKIGLTGADGYYPLNTTLYITKAAENVDITDKVVTLEYSMATADKNFAKAGLMVGSGLGEWVSTRASVKVDSSDTVGIVGFGADGIYAFGEKLMDYETENWYDFKVVLYGGTNLYDVYVNDSLIKDKGETEGLFNNIARSAFVGYKTKPATDISIYIDDAATSFTAKPMTELALYNGEELVTNLAVNNSAVTFTAKAKAETIKATNCRLYVASYEDGELAGVVCTDAKACKYGEDNSFETDITVSEITDKTQVKCFLWTDNLTPVANIISEVK